MKRFFRCLLGALGFVATSCEPAVEMYACPSVAYNEDIKGEQVDVQQEAIVVDEKDDEDEGR